MHRILELPARRSAELRNTPGIGYDVAQRIAQFDDSHFQEGLVAAAATAAESTSGIRACISTFDTLQDSAQLWKNPAPAA